MSRKQQRTLDRASLPLHGGLEAGDREVDAPVVRALYQSVNFIQEIGTADGLRYPRYGNAPNAEAVQRRMAALEGAEASVLLASGMGATACALVALLRPGDHIVASEWIYGGTRALLEEEFASLGIEVSLVDPLEVRVWRKTIRKNTRVVFVETPVNPTCRVLDLKAVSYICKQSGIALVVDATFASPINFRPLEQGADVSIHSATKYLNGHHDVLGGVVSGTIPYVEEVRRKMMLWGQAPDPFAAWLLERGLKTLDVRVQRQNANAMRIAEWAEKSRDVKRVHYPGLPSHPDYAVAKRTLDGFGGMMALELAGGARAVDRMLRRLRIFQHAPSLGGVDSLVSEPRHTSHAGVSASQRAKAGIPDGFVRLSIGIESADDLIADLEQALR
ncbi:MAG: PLP-dependent transferase [Gemmatimonadota bacterium]|nr:PLP-dependent transferase [Gemmatimonadota bacterium]MDE3128107.1 PLP-dependent transferase [Gemmatimonadota bacterium]MDE3174112.1 PLP-dependent transferase [Gemmatimonadota bacterium]MDE3215227.1 PLP-dependent transferase [Gemmatimonadota bacterium]